MKRVLFPCVLLWLAAVTGVVCADAIISDFEDGTMQGWVAIGDVAGVTNPGTGGNPGGFLRMVDEAIGKVCWVLAPAVYHGNWHGMTALSADLTQVSFSGSQFCTVQFVVSGPGGQYSYTFGERPPLGAWRTYGVSLVESLWTRNSGSWDALLDNVTDLKITLEFITGAETNGLDNVALTGDCPETTIGLAKQMPDGQCVTVQGVASRVMSDAMYIQQTDRAAGIRVKNSFARNEGDQVTVQGRLATACNERYLENAVVLSSTPGTSAPRPLHVNLGELGGKGATSADPQLGDSPTLKETGLLIRTQGTVSSVNPNGQMTLDHAGKSAGVVWDPSEALPVVQSFVALSGASSSGGSGPFCPTVAGARNLTVLALPLNANLVRNSGSEEGPCSTDGYAVLPIPGWTPTGNVTAYVYGGEVPVSESTAIGGGRSHFYGGYGAYSDATQYVDVSPLALSIDSGSLTADLSAYMGGYQSQGDNGKVVAAFLDSFDAVISQFQVGPQAGSNQHMILHQNSAPAPTGTRKIRVRMICTRLEGTWNSAYIDNVSLVLKQ